MEFGINKILTIAIPTYNRGDILKAALECLLPQCILFKDGIEIIISDNASTDNTQEVMLSLQDSYSELNILSNRNITNLGFHGNFKKCMELSSAKYIWILSDDDFVEDNVIEHIMEILQKREIGVLFLEFAGQNKKNEKLECTYYKNREIIKKAANRLSLISSVIFNRKGVDNKQLELFESNSLLGFIPVLNAISIFNCNAILTGKSLKLNNDGKIRFNPLKVFIIELNPVLEYFKKTSNTRLENAFLCTNILDHYIPWKFKGMFKDDNQYNKILFKIYKSYWAFWLIILPFILLPKYTPHFLIKGLYKLMSISIIKKYVGL